MVSMKVMATEAGCPISPIDQGCMVDLNRVGLQSQIGVAMLTELRFHTHHPATTVLTVATVALVRRDDLPLFGKSGFVESGNGMSVVWPIMACDAGIVFDFSEPYRGPLPDARHQDLCIVPELLPCRSLDRLVAGVAFEVLMSGIHGPFGLESRSGRHIPKACTEQPDQKSCCNGLHAGQGFGRP